MNDKLMLVFREIRPIRIICLVGIFILLISCRPKKSVVWQIGEADSSSVEFALAPDRYSQFLDEDFGWEDRFFLIGTSDPATDWPYVLPGPADVWGGTGGTSGWRSNTLNVLFSIEHMSSNCSLNLIVGIRDCNEEDLPLLKVVINGKSWRYPLLKGSGKKLPESDLANSSGYVLEIPLPDGLIKRGGNELKLLSIQGSWLEFDQIRLEGTGNVVLKKRFPVFVRNISAAGYEMEKEDESGRVQPLLVDVQHLSGAPDLHVLLDGKDVFSQTLDTGRYIFEVPMPAVSIPVRREYEILVDGQLVESGEVKCSPQKLITPAGYVNTKTGTAHSRWMIAPGPWMPFSMVKLSPDNQNGGWQAGYDPIFESVGGFSHIHEWTMAGLAMMPVNGELQIHVGDEKDPDSGYRSRLNTDTEEAPIGYYRADLIDYDIIAELTATTRAGFQRYTFPKEKPCSKVLIDLQTPAEYAYQIEEVKMRKVSNTRVEGFCRQYSPDTWAGGVSQEYVVHFVVEFDRPMGEFGVWTEKGIQYGADELNVESCEDAGAFMTFDTHEKNIVQVRTAISYVSIENAWQNLEAEISSPFGWNFEAVRQNNVDAWNKLFGRVKISSNDRREKMRFYNNMYRALCSRNTFSDVNGQWLDADEVLRQMTEPDSPALGCDAFWNTFWNLNQFWNLVTPEWSNRWVNSLLAMYDAGGWLAKGPAGMEYIPVMVAEHEIPLIVGAYQMGIRDFNAAKAFEAVKKMQTTPATVVGGGLAGNRDLRPYLKYQYVPYDKGRFSNTFEYSYDDWTVSQFAKALGKNNDYRIFKKRSCFWKNGIDKESGYARMKDSKGQWLKDFDPYKSGANHHYVEGNAWQLTFFVPQDVPALAQMIGRNRFVERLNWGFIESYKTRYNGKNDQYWNYPVVQGNQQSMHFAFLFNWVGKPWLTQKWSRAIIDRYYGFGLSNAYLGDEDQGQMSAWFVMASLGLFQTDGGCRVDPIYEIGSPLFKKVEIDLGQRFGRGEKFVIEARNASRRNKYVQSAVLNGKPLNSFMFRASELLKGGSLILEMGDVPKKNWGLVED